MYPPLKVAISGFVVMLMVLAALAVASLEGVVTQLTARRLLGVVLGAMAMHFGNLLPKLRAFDAGHFAGWVLVLSGAGVVGLFVLAPLTVAQASAPIVGLSALGAIAMNWSWRRPSKTPLAGALAFAFFYVLATGLVAFLPGPVRSTLFSWQPVIFMGLYAVLLARSSPRRSAP